MRYKMPSMLDLQMLVWVALLQPHPASPSSCRPELIHVDLYLEAVAPHAGLVCLDELATLVSGFFR